MPFRINRKKFGLTYSQCEASKEDLLSFLEGLGGELEYSIGQEPHKDGGLHLHAWVKFEKSLDSTNERIFDFDGFHPEINNPGKGWEKYCVKDGNYISNHWDEDPWVEMLDPKVSVANAMEILAKKRPREYCLNSARIEASLKKRKETTKRSWLTECEVHWGGPGAGKTDYVKRTYPNACWFELAQDSRSTSYNGEEVFVLSDVCEADLAERFFKRIIDMDEFNIRSFGAGWTQFIAKKVVITTNEDPGLWWGGTWQIRRRFHTIYKWSGEWPNGCMSKMACYKK